MNEPLTAPSSNSYHHGNLREALLAEAVTAIREQGPDKLSLRALARAVGVSQTAPYRHFADKNELLVELAKLTFDEITATATACFDAQTNWQSNMMAAGEAYLRYATSNPEKYRLLFGSNIERREQYPLLLEAGQRSFGVLLQLIEEGIKDGEFIDASPMLLANICWSGIHGFASLWIDGIFARRELPGDFDTMLVSQIKATVRAISVTPDAIKI